MVYVLTDHPSIANDYLVELRHVDIQQDRLRFRRNLERIGEMLAFEISKVLEYEEVEVETPLGLANTAMLKEQPVIATILRAGIPMHQGFMNVFDRADAAFVGAYRKVRKSGAFEIHKEYITSPDLNGKVLVVVDPMLGTGQSMVLSCKELLDKYKVKELHIATVIASEEGIAHVRAFLPQARLWVGDIDSELTGKAYIVPGLGDAGDLSYGGKTDGDVEN
ncbi:MAG TPA: uracil phosphoribosyltransferase [Sphingobacteriaceae bacterium]|nr:uracil phosphoribosyltransferase [Sphingobacteriaceae bacterium]